ncbi:DNA polymerase III, epsilon subunit [Palleronia salina]|uniref:DNA polymerase III, epsilon subunit n=1 Tax=Palleronia salina TaxID=313368 RepID=A0A1M6GS20_9RHOB|nr:exonuclease domain-containing protein [Palleronia salina]SHJ12699.1 DNA polymerase III, epsilon subunit [Palleronia salina]
MDAAIENFAILDFEASSLSQESWPIEVGLSWIENGHVQTWSSLIRPDPAWDLDDWSPQSAEVHGIPLSELEDAPPAAEVAEVFFDVVGRRRLASDAPEFEVRWLSRLLQAPGRVEIPLIEDFDAVSFAVFSGYALDMLYETVERRPAPHRAGLDTARLARGWLRAAEHQASLQTENKIA